MSDWTVLREKAEAAKEQMDSGPQEWPGRPSASDWSYSLRRAPRPSCDYWTNLTRRAMRDHQLPLRGGLCRCRVVFGLSRGIPVCNDPRPGWTGRTH